MSREAIKEYPVATSEEILEAVAAAQGGENENAARRSPARKCGISWKPGPGRRPLVLLGGRAVRSQLHHHAF